jgi:prefoldin subunit 5
MSQCTDVDAAIKRLEGKINAQNKLISDQNKQIADLKKKQDACCNNNGNNNNNNNQSLKDIYKRLQRLEQYCLSIESLFNQIGAILKPIVSIFK